MITYEQALIETTARLQTAGCQTPRLDATLLLSAATGKDKIQLYAHPKTKLSADEYARFETIVSRREKAEPMAYILGEKGFWDLDLKVFKGVLIPRPDTETLIQAVLDEIPEHSAPIKICDLGCGSGAIALSLLGVYKNAQGIAVDISPEALRCTTQNAQDLGFIERLRVLESTWLEKVPHEKFDVITSNPPYIPTGDMPGLMRDVRLHEPHLALEGGEDGLDAYRLIIKQAPGYLKKDGLLVFEVGKGQADPVTQILAHSGSFGAVSKREDLSGTERVVFARAI